MFDAACKELYKGQTTRSVVSSKGRWKCCQLISEGIADGPRQSVLELPGPCKTKHAGAQSNQSK